MNDRHDLHVFIAQVTDEMASEYERIYQRAATDPGTAGDEGEENWANLLREWLPPAYQVYTKGRLISAKGELSPQIDVLVLKPFYPKKLTEKRIWLADGVAAAFECKTTLTAQHVSSSYKRSRQFKELIAPRKGSPREELNSALVYGLLAHSHSWKGPKSKPVENISSALAQAAIEGDHPSHEPDFVCVADLGFWARFFTSCYDSAWASEERREIYRKIFGADVGPQTGYMASTISSEDQESEFRPVGAFIATLTRLLAWDDTPLRSIADYYRAAGLWGRAAEICGRGLSQYIVLKCRRKFCSGNLAMAFFGTIGRLGLCRRSSKPIRLLSPVASIFGQPFIPPS